MEIIKRGKISSEKSAIFTCTSCGSELKATLGEGKVTHCQRDGDYVTFVCCVCFRQIHVGLEFFE